MYNILTDPLIRFDLSDRSRVIASLPEVYAALMAAEVDAFPGLRPHQRHAWHAFLVQLGTMAMHRSGRRRPAVRFRRLGGADSQPHARRRALAPGGGRHHQTRLHAAASQISGRGEGLPE